MVLALAATSAGVSRTVALQSWSSSVILSSISNVGNLDAIYETVFLLSHVWTPFSSLQSWISISTHPHRFYNENAYLLYDNTTWIFRKCSIEDDRSSMQRPSQRAAVSDVWRRESKHSLWYPLLMNSAGLFNTDRSELRISWGEKGENLNHIVVEQWRHLRPHTSSPSPFKVDQYLDINDLVLPLSKPR